MVAFSFGPNTTAFSVANRVLIEIVRKIYGELSNTSISVFDEFRSFLRNNKGRNIVFSGTNLEPKVIDAIERSQAVVIIFTQDPTMVISELMAHHGLDLLSAARIHSLHYASMDSLIGRDGTHYISLDGENCSLFVLIRTLGEIFGKQFNQAEVDAVQKRLISDNCCLDIDDITGLRPISKLGVSARDQMDPRDVDAIDIAFPPINRIPDYGWRWPSRFFYGPTTDTLADQPIYLLGKSRTIFFGPFMYLSPGHWRATYKINIARNWSGNVVLADIQAKLVVLAAGKLALPKEGSFEFSLDFTIQLDIMPVEMRLHLLEGAIQGYLEMVDVQLTQIPPATAAFSKSAIT